jgi:hypothetical protein
VATAVSTPRAEAGAANFVCRIVGNGNDDPCRAGDAQGAHAIVRRAVIAIAGRVPARQYLHHLRPLDIAKNLIAPIDAVLAAAPQVPYSKT